MVFSVGSLKEMLSIVEIMVANAMFFRQTEFLSTPANIPDVNVLSVWNGIGKDSVIHEFAE